MPLNTRIRIAVLSSKIVRRGGEIVIVGMAKPGVGVPSLAILKKELMVSETRMTKPTAFKNALEFLNGVDPKDVEEIKTGYWKLDKSVEGVHYAEKNGFICIKEVIDCR